MNSELLNRLNLIKYSEKMVELCYELNQAGLLSDIFNLEKYYLQRKKLEAFGISLTFNFSLWKKLEECSSYFNYLKISKRICLKEKWLTQIVENIPEIQTILLESHAVFEKYKNILFTILEN